MKRELYSSLLLLIVLFFLNEITVLIGRFVLGTGMIWETLVTEHPLHCCIGGKGGLGDVLLTEQTLEPTQCSPVRGNRLSVFTLSSFLLEFDFGFERKVCFYCISSSLCDLIGNNLRKKLTLRS